MESLVKKYFWLINLALLAVIALLAARVVNNWVAERIVSLPTTPNAAADDGKKRGAGALAGGPAHWSTIADRNLFNSNPPEADPNAGDTGEEPPPEPIGGRIPLPGEDCEESSAKLGLLATMVADPSQWSMAVIDDDAKESRLIKEGQRVSEHTVASIQRDRLVLLGSGKYSCVALGKKSSGSKAKSYTAKGDTTSSKAKSNIKDGIKKTGANSYEIDREMLNEQLDDLSALSRQARVIPHYRGGKPQGFKIVGVRPGSLYSHIGLRSGDVIKGVNDEAITSPNKALELYEKLKNEDNVSVDIERRGRKLTNEYSIK